MEPRVSKRERKLHLSYDLPHRIHAAQLYPIPSPNGSTLVIYANDRGLRLLWRVGKRRRAQPRTNGRAQDHDIIIIDSSSSSTNSPQLQDSLEDEEDELDPDCPYPNIISSVSIDFGAEVLQLAIPALPPLLRKTDALHNHGAVAISCSDGSQRVVTFDLLPPTSAEAYANDVLARQILLNLSGVPCTGLAAKIATSPESLGGASFLLVAASSDMLRTYRFAIFNDLTNINQDAETSALSLLHEAKSVAFHPSTTSTQLLISDTSGAIRICDPFTPATSENQEAGVTEMHDPETTPKPPGKYLFAFTTPYTNSSSSSGGVARRKQILSAAWVLNGNAILALLEDGEWCIWNLAPTEQTGGNFSEPTLRGFLRTSNGSERQGKNTSRLAPMTPNTRKTKSENFFAGPAPKIPGGSAAAACGGVSVVTSSLRANLPDESVILWYNGEIYSIPSLQTFWQRSTNRGGGGGGLYAPGLTQIKEVDMGGERVTSVSQFAPTAASSGVGTMNTQRDLLISTEHRFIVLQSLRATTPARGLFQAAGKSGEVDRDQRMLDFGQLDLGGIDRVLDGMANGEGRTRRVGFAR
ncbi:hypothetical protein LTR97_012341 [Elasticomyces elasticus]|uniref:Nucleoporin NUP37 n=1 Tax=Elasticomyces elasticus TaxID=574655 RepID=A0AAN7VM47_9PEZI|nr:hypothetical protein LTR97_012341 [Elasticomyces elasticus]